jgi:beta-galactosidase
LGCRVEQFYALDQSVALGGIWGSGTSSIWAEQLSASAPDVKVLMTYGRSNGWLDNQPAAITRNVGKGSITYIGAMLDPKLTQSMAANLLTEYRVEPAVPNVPEGVEASVRSGEDGREVLILINHTAEAKHIALDRSMHDILHGASIQSIDLSPHDVSVLAREGAR